MIRFMDLEEARQSNFREIFKELNNLHLLGMGRLLRIYYKYRHKNINFIQTATRQWEYPWAIINSKIEHGNCVLDAGCGGSPLLPYLYKRGCLSYGLDNKFSYEADSLSSYTIKNRIAQWLSKFYPFYFLVNPHGQEGLCRAAKALRLNIKYIKGDLTNLPFNNNSFDRIFSISVIEHLSKQDMFIAGRELSRILKPKGLLIVTVDCWGTGLFWQDFIKLSGLGIYGDIDLMPSRKIKYNYDVVGFILKKE